VDDVHEKFRYRLVLFFNDTFEYRLEEDNRLSDLPRYFIVLVPELDFLEYREGNRVNEYNATIHT
jgi:hypothetical protein